MVGSGPYRFVPDEYVNGSRVSVRKDKYISRAEPVVWATGAKQAFFPRIVWNIVPDAATAGAALQNNEIDWWSSRWPICCQKSPPTRTSRCRSTSPGGASPGDPEPGATAVQRRAIRRAVMMAVRQEDYMRATFGDDQSLWRVSKDVFPFGTPYYSGADGDAMKGDLTLAAKMLKEAGIGQKVALMNPTDFAAIHPLGLVTADALKQIDITSNYRKTDGTVVQRLATFSPWKMAHEVHSIPSPLRRRRSPATNSTITGRGAKGWFGWWDNPRPVPAVQWVNAPTRLDKRKRPRACRMRR